MGSFYGSKIFRMTNISDVWLLPTCRSYGPIVFFFILYSLFFYSVQMILKIFKTKFGSAMFWKIVKKASETHYSRGKDLCLHKNIMYIHIYLLLCLSYARCFVNSKIKQWELNKRTKLWQKHCLPKDHIKMIEKKSIYPHKWTNMYRNFLRMGIK